MKNFCTRTLVALSIASLPTLAHATDRPSRRAQRFVGSYENALQLPVEYDLRSGDAAQEGLDSRAVAQPLDRAIPRFARCVAREQARGVEFASVELRVVVGSGGTALGVSVDHDSAAFRACATSVVRGLHWRPFIGPRVAFTWSFTVE